MKYNVTIIDMQQEKTYEYKINNMSELRDILECFKDRIIEVDLKKVEQKTLRRIK